MHENISKLIKNSNKNYDYSILTTNYDVCIEKALKKDDIKSIYLGLEEGEGIPIIKIHGSVNWFYCEGCQSVIIYDLDELKQFTKVYPLTGSCQVCLTPTELFMIPPIAYKYVMFPPIVDIWQSATKTLEEADIIIVIGYSFSLSDDYILKMIMGGLKKKQSSFIFLTRSYDTVNKLKRRLASYHEDIDLEIIEDASISMPIVREKIENIVTKKKRSSKNDVEEKEK